MGIIPLIILNYWGSLLVITGALRSERGGRIVNARCSARKTPSPGADFENGRKLWVKEWEGPREAGRGKAVDFLLKPSEGTQQHSPLDTLVAQWGPFPTFDLQTWKIAHVLQQREETGSGPALTTGLISSTHFSTISFRDQRLPEGKRGPKDLSQLSRFLSFLDLILLHLLVKSLIPLGSRF